MNVSTESCSLVGESRRDGFSRTPERNTEIRTPDPDAGRVQRLLGEVRRLWAIAAAAKISFEKGPAAVSPMAVAERSGIPHIEILAMFPEPDGLLEATFGKAAAVAAEYAIPRFVAEPDPLERSRLAAAHLLAFCEAEPELAWACVADCVATRPARAQLARTLSRVVTDWFDGYPTGGEQERLVAGSIGEALDAIADALQARGAMGLGDLYATTLETVLTPLVGATAARIVAARPAPEVRPPEAPLGPRGERLVLDLRLTADLLDELKGFPAAKDPQ